MSHPRSVARHSFAIALCFACVALCVFYYFIPNIRRPMDVLSVIVAVLSIVLAVAAKSDWLRSFFLVLMSLSLGWFLLELGEKHLKLSSWFARSPAVAEKGGPKIGPTWNTSDPESYREKLREAEAQGFVRPEPVDNSRAFEGVDPSSLVTDKIGVGGHTSEVGLKRMRQSGIPLGYELNPDNKTRHFSIGDDGFVFFDGLYTTNEHGFRNSADSNESGDVHVFLGCSFTHGWGVMDNETLPYNFNRAGGFGYNVLNLGVPGYGPHQALRDLETNLHMGRANIDPKRVKGVYYGLIHDHATRVVTEHNRFMPFYALENGRPVYKGTFDEARETTRLDLLVSRSRVLSAITGGLMRREAADVQGRSWELAHAILKEIDRIARERYGVGLIVIDWNDMANVDETIRNNGITVVTASDAFGADWRDEAVKYLIVDGHPTALAYKMMGDKLHETAAGKPQTVTTR